MLNRIIRKPQFLIPAFMTAAIILVGILAWNSLRPYNDRKGFTRRFISPVLKTLSFISKPENVIDFSGANDQYIYLKTKDPTKIYAIDLQLHNIEHIELNIPNNKKVSSRFNSIVDSPYIYILAGNVPAIIKTRPGDTSIIYPFPNSLFTRAVFLSDHTIALRMFEKTDQIFAKGNPSTGELLKENNVSEKNKDAGISTDGILLYDKQQNLLTYVYYYRNEILQLDTNLNLVKKSKTIDIKSTFAPKAKKVQSKSLITSLAPQKLLNAASQIYVDHIFINSKSIADNEKSEAFEGNSVIDIYKTKNMHYIGSFYVPNYKNEKLRSFKIIKTKLFALYKNYLVVYSLPLELIK